MVHCPFCDAQLSSDDAYATRCPQCGSQLLWNDDVPAPEGQAVEPPRVLDSNPSLDQIVSTIVGRGEFESAAAAPPSPAPNKTIETAARITPVPTTARNAFVERSELRSD